ncbi:MAG: MATE family efflux transporter [Lentisphaeria bacterium]
MKNRKAGYLDGAIGLTMIKTAFSMVVGTLAMSGYNIADAYFVGRMGTKPLAAMGFTFPIILFITFIFRGISVGILASASRAVGGGKRLKAAKFIGAGRIMILFCSFLVGLFGLLSMNWIFKILGAGEEVMVYIIEYMSFIYIFTVVQSLSSVGNDLLISVGTPFLASIMMVSGMLLNVILDPIFIFGFGIIPGLGMMGAALATIISQAVVALFSWWMLHSHHKLVMSVWNFLLLKKIWLIIIRFAIPSILGLILVPLGNAVIVKVVAGFGDGAVAAVAAAGRIEMIAFIFPMALGITLMPMVSQNFGARLYSRIRECHLFSSRFAMIYLLIMALVFWVGSPFIVKFFSKDLGVQTIMISYLKIIPFGYAFIELHRYSAFFFTGTGQPKMAAILNVVRIVFILIPLVMLASWLRNLHMVFVARLLADVIAGILGWSLVGKMLIKLPRNGDFCNIN